MNAHASLNTIETRLRRLILDRLGDDWFMVLKAPQRSYIESSRDNDAAKRLAAVPAPGLIDFTDTNHLTKIIRDRWDVFEPVFRDRDQLEARFLILENTRHTIAHNRATLPHEDDSMAGVAGWIANMIAIERAERAQDDADYPLIEGLADETGRRLVNNEHFPMFRSLGTYEVGDVLTIHGESTAVRGRKLLWSVEEGGMSHDDQRAVLASAEGETVDLSFEFTTPRRNRELRVILTTDSQWHRHSFPYEICDDIKRFDYTVRPPREE